MWLVCDVILLFAVISCRVGVLGVVGGEEGGKEKTLWIYGLRIIRGESVPWATQRVRVWCIPTCYEQSTSLEISAFYDGIGYRCLGCDGRMAAWYTV